jgi:hypothetical protein
MEQNLKTVSLPAIVRKRLGISQYAMSRYFRKTPKGYAAMEQSSRKYSLDDIVKLRRLGGYSWEELGALIEGLVGAETSL